MVVKQVVFQNEAKKMIQGILKLLYDLWSVKAIFNVPNNSKNSVRYSVKATGCSLNIVIFPKILEYCGLWYFSVFPLCQCMYTHQAGRTPALQ